MARSRKVISIDEKIEKAQEIVARSKARYDAAVTDLKQLMEKREAMKKEELIKAITSSRRSYEEIMVFIQDGAKMVEG